MKTHTVTGQVILEVTLVFIAILVLLLGMTRIWYHVNNDLGRRQSGYNGSRDGEHGIWGFHSTSEITDDVVFAGEQALNQDVIQAHHRVDTPGPCSQLENNVQDLNNEINELYDGMKTAVGISCAGQSSCAAELEAAYQDLESDRNSWNNRYTTANSQYNANNCDVVLNDTDRYNDSTCSAYRTERQTAQAKVEEIDEKLATYDELYNELVSAQKDLAGENMKLLQCQLSQ